MLGGHGNIGIGGSIHYLDFYLDAEAERRMRDNLAERLSGGEGLTVSQIREILQTTRKYAVPLCEYLDRIGFTERQGDVRVLSR